MLHVAPCDREGYQSEDHELEGTMCHCGPEVDWENAEAIVIHESRPGYRGRWGVFKEEGTDGDFRI